MRTFRFSKQCPEGKIFDTDPGNPDPYPPPTESQGWFDNPGRLRMTTDEVIEAAVKAELAKQNSDREKLEKEFEHKTGEIPHFASKDKTLTGVLDDNRAYEKGKKWRRP